MMPVNRQSPHNRPYPWAAYRWPDGRDTARSGNYLEEVTIMATTVTQRVWIRGPGRADAEDAVKRIAGVTTVVNQIEEPPESPSDTQTSFVVYGSTSTENGPLFRYALEIVPAIHIVVRNGRLILQGAVETTADKSVAASDAASVAGVVDVINELTVQPVPNTATSSTRSIVPVWE